MHEFPDRELLGEDVIWCGTPEEGMLSSHRLICTATHTGDGVYGVATGKKLRYRILADCHAVNNQINDEWLVRDQSAIVRQMGWTLPDYTRSLIEREGGPEACGQPFHPSRDQAGSYSGRGNNSEWGVRLATILERIMGADMAAIPETYDRAVSLEYPGYVSEHGWAEADKFWMRLRASFPSAEFRIHHQIGRDDPTMAPRAAVRWSLTGKHDGWGAFGQPSGAEVHVMGMTQAEFGTLGVAPSRLRREWTLIDETAIWKQILLHTGQC